MKKVFYVLAAALFCFAACDKQEVLDTNLNDNEDVYEIEISSIDTKGSAPSSVELQMGSKESDYLVATLKKNGNPVDGASYSWSDPQTGGYYSGYTSESGERRYNISAIKAGSGSAVSVTGYDGGIARATSVNIPINVSEDPSVYEIVISYVGVPTPPDPSPVSLKMGKTETRTLSATLKKNGSTVNGASFTWYKSGGSYFSGSAGGTLNSQYTITALSAGSGSYVYVTAKANPSAPTITSDNIYVVVAAADTPSEPEKVYRDEHIYFKVYLNNQQEVIYRGKLATYLGDVGPLTFSDNFHNSYTIPSPLTNNYSGEEVEVVLRTFSNASSLIVASLLQGPYPGGYGWHLTRDSGSWWYTNAASEMISEYCVESETSTKISYVRYIMHLQ